MAEFAQYDKYGAQDMFGHPIPRPVYVMVSHWVWQRPWKEDATAAEKGEFQRKCCSTCDGGPKYGKAVILAETYTTCIEQPICQVFWALVAVLAGNALAEAPPPVAPFYMKIDDTYESIGQNILVIRRSWEDTSYQVSTPFKVIRSYLVYGSGTSQLSLRFGIHGDYP